MQIRLSSPQKAFPILVALTYSLLNFTFVYGQAPAITTLDPTRNATSVPRNANVSVTFSQAMNAVTASKAAIHIYGSQTGLRTLPDKGSFSGGGTNTATFNSTTDFKPGEQVAVSVTAKAQSTDSTALAKPQVFNFTAASDLATANFTKTSQVLLGSYPSALCPADLDGDGDIDLAAINSHEGGISLRFNDGKGNLLGKEQAYGGLYATDMNAADFDGDGDVDLAGITARFPDISIVRNDGKGNFNSGIAANFSLDEQREVQYSDLTHLTSGDWDNDGDMDMMISIEFQLPYDTPVDPGIFILTNNGTFTNTPLIFQANWINTFSNGDWDNDGDLDVAVATSDGIFLLFNDGAGNFPGNTKIDLLTSSLQPGDFDHDGDLDIAASTTAGIAIRYNNGSGSFTGNDLISIDSISIDIIPRLSTADFNGDGYLDLASTSSGKVSILLNNGTGGFAIHSSFPENTYLLTVADFNGDQALDIATVTVSEQYNPNTAAIWLNNAALPNCTASGSILREYWANVPGHNIKDIPLTTPPTSTDQLTNFRTRANVADSYGQRIRGYICAPVTGNYTFFIQGDDKAELYLSRDTTEANKQRIASARVAWSWTRQASQKSAPLELVAGQRYYVEVLHKEGVGGDQVRVGWRTPEMTANADPVIIPGAVLSPYLPTTSQPTGLLACYTFSGNARDGSGQGNDGTVNGATLTSDRFGKANSAYAFNGQSDYISIPSASLHNNTYTYSLWVKATSIPSVGLAAFPLSIGGYGGDQGIALANQYVVGNNQGWVGGSYNTNGVSNYYPVGSLPALNTWYHLALTRSSATVSFYVNGQLAGTIATDGFPAAYNGNSAIIGARFNLSQYFQGAIDDIQLYNRTLSAAEVITLYQQTSEPCSATPTARQTGLVQEGLLSQLKVYPNPTTGITTVEFTPAETGWLGVRLYNLQGQPLQLLFGQEVEAGTVHQRVLDASALPTGLYLIRLVNGKRTEHHKLVVNH